MSAKSREQRLGIILPPGVDPSDWAKKFEENLVPDRLPYGLHRLNRLSKDSVALQASPLGISGKASLMSNLLRVWGGSSIKTSLDVGVSWDEYTAAKMVAQFPARAMFSGVIWATDEWLSGRRRLRGEVTRRLLSRFAGLWCLSRPQVDELQRQTSNRIPVDFLPFGIDHNFFTYSPQPTGMRIISLGVDRDRDPETLFAALDIVHQKLPEAEILVQTNSARPLPDGVARFDRVPHSVLRDLYRTANVVLVPTKHNLHASGMTVALEAGATGRPVVACNTPGMEDYVINGKTGLLVPPGDPVAMADATLEVLYDREQAEFLGYESRRYVEESHTSELMIEKLVEIIAKGL